MPNPEIRFLNENGSSYPDWEFCKLGDVCLYKSSQLAENKLMDNTGIYPIYGAKGIVKYINFYEMEQPYISIIKDGAGVGRLKLYSEKSSVIGTLAYLCNQNTPIKFLYYLLQTIDFNIYVSGSTIPHIYYKDYSMRNISIPSNQEEQERIAEFFTSLDNSIMSEEAKLKNIKNYKKSMLQQMFTEDGNPLMRFTKDDGSDYGDWEFKQLSEVADVNPSNNGLPNEFIYIDLESVTNGVFTPNKPIYLKDSPSRAQRLLQDNDIIFQTVRPYQRNNLYFNLQRKNNFPYVASTGYAQIRAKQNSMYLYQYLYYDSFVNDVLTYCSGSNYPAINSSDLVKINIALPTDIEEQERIAEFFSSLDLQIDLHSKKLANLKKYKKSMLQKMFV